MDSKRCVMGHVVVIAAVGFLAACSSNLRSPEPASPAVPNVIRSLVLAGLI
jgi:hypothetical protein